MEERRLAVITGASTGIGYELAREFLKHDFDLVLTADESAIWDRESELKRDGHRVRAVQANLATREGVEDLYSAIREEARHVYALVLNAGIGVSGDFVRENSLEEEMNLLAVNVIAPVHLAKLIMPGMVEAGEGRVLITSSVSALMPGPYFATYAASKAFLLSFAEALGKELEDTDISVTALLPGATDTQFFARAGMEDTPVGKGEKDDAADVAKQAFRALMEGDDYLVAGSFKNKLQAWGTRFLTERQKAVIHEKKTKPDSAA